MSPHMSGELLANRIQTQQRLPAANPPLSAPPSRLRGMRMGGGVTEQTVLYIVLHMTCKVSQQLETDNKNVSPHFVRRLLFAREATVTVRWILIDK